MRRAPRRIFVIIACLACAGAAGGSPSAAPAGSWTGTARFVRGAGLQPFAMSIELRGRRAAVSLAPGHAARTQVSARVAGNRVRLSLPGRPWPLALDGRVRGRVFSGTLRQGPLRGAFLLRRRAPIESGSYGLYRFSDGRPLAIWQAIGRPLATLYDDGEIRGLYQTGRRRYAVGAGIGVRSPSPGTLALATGSAAYLGRRAARVPVRQEEVWVRAGTVYLACTLTIPPGSGRRPALAFAHGGGEAPRSFNSAWQHFANNLGLITLSCDKRGVGQSGGRYEGFPSAGVVDLLARDVEAQARWLAGQPEVDPARIGIAGASQAGWIMPVAAGREPAIRFMLGLVPPTLTQGETDLWANLNSQGQAPPTRSDEDMEAEVRAAGPSGVDPMPAIRAMRVPAIWLFGGKDRTVPTRLCVERLDPVTKEPGRDFTYRVFAGGTHGLILTANGLLDEQERSNRFVDGLFQTARDWLAARSFTGSLTAS